MQNFVTLRTRSTGKQSGRKFVAGTVRAYELKSRRELVRLRIGSKSLRILKGTKPVNQRVSKSVPYRVCAAPSQTIRLRWNRIMFNQSVHLSEWKRVSVWSASFRWFVDDFQLRISIAFICEMLADPISVLHTCKANTKSNQKSWA